MPHAFECRFPMMKIAQKNPGYLALVYSVSIGHMVVLTSSDVS